MERAKLALTILSIELRNARSRQRSRLKRKDTQSLAIENVLIEMGCHARKLRFYIKRMEKLEGREQESRKLSRDKRDKMPGLNRRMTGTLGK